MAGLRTPTAVAAGAVGNLRDAVRSNASHIPGVLGCGYMRSQVWSSADRRGKS